MIVEFDKSFEKSLNKLKDKSIFHKKLPPESQAAIQTHI